MLQTHTATLPIEDMPHNAKVLKIYSEHSYKPLLSLGQLADSGYIFSGNDKIIILRHPAYKPLIALRESASGMYLLNLKNPHKLPKSISSPQKDTSLQKISNLIPKEQFPDLVNNVHVMTTKTDLAIYYHRALSSPVPSTLIKAIKAGFFAT